MFAYVDETGNTGSNIFDPDQPEFFTAALITKSNFDIVHKSSLNKICARLNVQSLHASVSGFGIIEAAAPELLRLLKKVDARFFVSRVEKKYLLATKVFDTFFDSGENPAVPWTIYNVRPLRITLAFKVASLIDDDLARRFWAMLMAKSEQKARAIIPEICDSFLSRVDILTDARSRRIISDAFIWSRTHPEALNIYIPGRQAKNGHMPNIVAFTNLLRGLDHISKRWNRPVRQIIHDRQSQFEGMLTEWHRLTTNASPEPVYLPGEVHVMQNVPGSNFVFSASDDSPGIQVADTILWLFKKFLSGSNLPIESNKLLTFVMRRVWQSDFSFKGVSEQLNQNISHIFERQLTLEEMALSQQIREQDEQSRLHAMKLYEKDGLMPYQRQA